VIRVLFYTKPDCGLCDEAWALLRRWEERYPLAIQVRDIRENPEWFERYWDRIPVIQVEGGATLEAPIHPGDLERALAQVARQRGISSTAPRTG